MLIDASEVPPKLPAERRAAAGRRARPAGADVSHGAILYLESVSVSFDGLKAINDLNLSIDRRRAALHHRARTALARRR